jgi:hypothetical protein
MKTAALVPCLALVLCTACVKNKRSEADQALSDRPRATVSAELTKCAAAGPALVLDRVVEDGWKMDGGAVAVSCKVAKNGPGFFVDAKIGVAGVGKLTFTSPLDLTGRSAAGDATLERAGASTWTSERCALDPVTTQPGLYEAKLLCPAATTPKGEPCEISAKVRLENCVAE